MPDINILFCYARKDKDLFIQLKNHLQPLKRQGFISEWSDNTISPGTAWQQELATQLDSASIIALLISPDFFASDDMYSVAMQHIIKQHGEGKARLIPVLLKTVNWKVPPFAELSPLPTNARPVTEWRDRNKAFLDIAEALQEVIRDLRSRILEQQEDPVFVRIKDVAFEEKVPTSEEEVPRPKRGLGMTILRYDAHTRGVNSVAWSPDGQRIASGSGDGTVRIWDSATGKNLLTYRKQSDLFFSRVWDAKWSPDGRFVASCGLGVTVHVWDAQTGNDLVLYRHHMLTNFMTDTHAVTWSPDGTSIASATGGLQDIDETIHVWNAATGSTQLKYSGHASGNIIEPFTISTIAWSPDGQYIASGGIDKTVKKWTLNPLTSFQSARIWNARTGQHIATSHGSSSFIYELSWSLDSSKITTAEIEGKVHVWDACSGEKLLTYSGHTKAVRAVAWSPDGSRVASASNDRTVQIWEATTGKLLYVYREHTDNATTIAWSPDGTRIASAGSDSIVRIWQAV